MNTEADYTATGALRALGASDEELQRREGETAAEHQTRLLTLKEKLSSGLDKRLIGDLDEIPDDAPPPGMRLARWSTLVILAACIAFTIWGYQTGVFTNIDELQAFMTKTGIFGPLVLIAFQAVQVVFPVLPGGIGLVAGPLLFGPVLGSIYNWVGICIGSVYVFHLARLHGIGLIERIFPRKLYQKYRKWVDHPNFQWWFLAAIVLPIAPDDFLCYLAGTTNMKARNYWLIIWLGKPWAIVAYSFILVYGWNWLLPGLKIGF